MSITLTEVRQHLLNTLADLRRTENPMDVARARAVAEVAGVLVDTARVEVDYLRAVGGRHAGFLADSEVPQVELQQLPGRAGVFDGLTVAVAGVTRHVLRD